MDALNGRVLLELRRSKIELEAIAGGEHCDLGHNVAAGRPAKLDKIMRVAVPILLRDCELLPHLDRCLVVAEAHDVDLHHGVDLVLRIVAEPRESLHGVLLHLPHPILSVAVHPLELLPKLALADGEGRLPKTIDGVNQRGQQLIDLAEDAAQLCLTHGLHGGDDIRQLPATQHLCLVLQSRDLRHEVCNRLLHVIETPPCPRQLRWLGHRRHHVHGALIGGPQLLAHAPPPASEARNRQADNADAGGGVGSGGPCGLSSCPWEFCSRHGASRGQGDRPVGGGCSAPGCQRCGRSHTDKGGHPRKIAAIQRGTRRGDELLAQPTLPPPRQVGGLTRG
mmetsp:Transcript_5012/g.15763  ORF Transcript_5012/g.15763 Transcript_5012/m.15763 type:complete len:337 (+) Transcript_5012:887-1897(+)